MFKRKEQGSVMLEAVLTSLLIVALSLAALFFATLMYRRWYLDLAVTDAARYYSAQLTSELRTRPRCGVQSVLGWSKLRIFIAQRWGLQTTAESFFTTRSSTGKCMLVLSASDMFQFAGIWIGEGSTVVTSRQEIPVEDPCYACDCA